MFHLGKPIEANYPISKCVVAAAVLQPLLSCTIYHVVTFPLSSSTLVVIAENPLRFTVVAELENPPLRLRTLDPVRHGGCCHTASERRCYDSDRISTDFQNGKDTAETQDTFTLLGGRE